MRSTLQFIVAVTAVSLVFASTPTFGGRFGGGGGGRGGGGGGGMRGGGGFSGGGARGGGGFSGGFSGGGGNFNSGVNRGGGNFSRPQVSRPPVARSSPVSRPAQISRPPSMNHGSVHGPYGGTLNSTNRSHSLSGVGGGSGVANRQLNSYTGPRGGVNVGQGSRGSYTTPGGSTISGGKGGNVYHGPNGGTVIAGGKGGTVTGPGGNTIGGGKGGAAVIGPNGNIHASGGKGIAAKTPNGAIAAGSRGAVNVGPNGATASGSRGGIATGRNGTIAGGSRGAVAVGPHGAVAGGGRGVVGRGVNGNFAAGTRYVGASNLAGQGRYVRNNFGYYNAFRPGWNNRYPGAWFAAGWVASSAWNYMPWGGYTSYVGYPVDVAPYSYDYGNNITYQDGMVCYDDTPTVSEADFADQASQIAATGQQVQPTDDEKWLALGVFAMTKGEETTSNDIFQLAINKDGVIRGNYYNAAADTTTPLTGSLDKKSQRVAWTVGDKKYPVYEAGLYNLSNDQTTMLVHLSKEETTQYNLFRLEQPKDGDATKDVNTTTQPSSEKK